MTGPSISVVICAYSELRWASLVAGVTEVAQQLADRDELIVVIDHNEPMLARAEAAFSNAVVLANVESSGLSGARNTGVSRASREIVVFLDDDALPEPGWLDGLRGGYGQPALLGWGESLGPCGLAALHAGFPMSFCGWSGAAITGCRRRWGRFATSSAPTCPSVAASSARSAASSHAWAGLARFPRAVRKQSSASASVRSCPAPCCCTSRLRLFSTWFLKPELSSATTSGAVGRKAAPRRSSRAWWVQGMRW